MPSMQHEILIASPLEPVFDYVSTPGRWPEWHPSSLRLEAGADRPLTAGESFEEDIRAGGRKTHLSWIVRECRRPELWVADARGENGIRLQLEYRLTAAAGGTRFVRTLSYELPNALYWLYNRLYGQRRIEQESVQSLRQLRDVMAGS